MDLLWQCWFAIAGREKPVLLKIPVAFSTNLPGLKDPILYISDRIAALSSVASRCRSMRKNWCTI